MTEDQLKAKIVELEETIEEQERQLLGISYFRLELKKRGLVKEAQSAFEAALTEIDRHSEE